MWTCPLAEHRQAWGRRKNENVGTRINADNGDENLSLKIQGKNHYLTPARLSSLEAQRNAEKNRRSEAPSQK